MRKLLLIGLLSFAVFGYTYHGAYLLDGPVAPPSAAGFGMGSLTVLPPDGSPGALWAPALITKDGFQAQFGILANNFSEDRSLPLYDSYDELVAWRAYSSIVRTWTNFSGSVAYGFKEEWLPSIALSYAPVFDAGYEYREQIREGAGANEDRIIGTWAIDSKGQLAGPTIAVSEEIKKFGSIGISVTMLSGTLEMRRSAPVGDSLSNSEPWEAVFAADTFYSADLSGTMINFSIVATPTERWQIGLRYTPKVTFDKTLYPDLLPSRLGIGFAFKPSGYIPSRIVFETELVRWSELAEADSAYAVLKDAWEFRIGLEHQLSPTVPLRVGAHYRTVPVADPVSRIGFNVGSGIRFEKFFIDYSAGYEMSEYNHHDLFPESWLPGSPADRTGNDKVQETTLSGALSVGYEF